MNLTKTILYYVLFAMIFIVGYGLYVEKQMVQLSQDSGETSVAVSAGSATISANRIANINL
jgi:hypothetical protein